MARLAAPAVPDLSGKTVLITGANTGIGQETAVALARAGATVTITARDAAKGAVAVDDIRQRSGNSAVDVMDLDLASLASVREFAATYAATHPTLDVLVNNAGVMLTQRRVTEDGNEMVFQVNHLGPFLLTNLLRDPLVAGKARVVNLSSDAHKQGGKTLDFDALQSPGGVSARNSMSVYGRTKLENILFTRELAKRWAADGVTSNAVHPGWVNSSFGRDGDSGKFGDLLIGAVAGLFALSTEAGAYTSVYVASSPDVATVTGRFFAKCKEVTPSAAAQDDDAAARLWDVSRDLTGL